MLKKAILKKSVSAMLPMFALAGIGFSPASTSASTISLQDISNPRASLSKHDHAPPVNPPIDTPAFYNGLVNAPTMMPASVPPHTLPGSGFGHAAIPVPAA